MLPATHARVLMMSRCSGSRFTRPSHLEWVSGCTRHKLIQKFLQTRNAEAQCLQNGVWFAYPSSWQQWGCVGWLVCACDGVCDGVCDGICDIVHVSQHLYMWACVLLVDVVLMGCQRHLVFLFSFTFGEVREAQPHAGVCRYPPQHCHPYPCGPPPSITSHSPCSTPCTHTCLTHQYTDDTPETMLTHAASLDTTSRPASLSAVGSRGGRDVVPCRIMLYPYHGMVWAVAHHGLVV